MKYKYGDVLLYKPGYYLSVYKTGFDPVQILKWSDKYKRYLCFAFDMDGTSDTWHLAYIKESDLGDLAEINESPLGYPVIPENLDTRYFKIYLYDDLNMTLIQNDVGKRKNSYDLPVRN